MVIIAGEHIKGADRPRVSGLVSLFKEAREILMKDNEKTGLRYFEAGLVSVIFGVIAVTILPRLTEASPEARICSLVNGLERVRTQIKLYKTHHQDHLPGAGAATFEKALTQETNIVGAINRAGPYGPYLGKIPKNPFNDLDTVEVEAGGSRLGDGNCGWHFNIHTGEFHADTDTHSVL